MWQDFSSRNTDENWRRREKTQRLAGQYTHKKLSPEHISLNLAYNMPPRLLYRSPPLAPLTSHYVPRNSGAHLTKTTTTAASKEGNDQMEEDRTFFPPQTNRFPDLSPYNRLQVIQHCSVFSLSVFFDVFLSDNICF